MNHYKNAKFNLKFFIINKNKKKNSENSKISKNKKIKKKYQKN